jgi:regulatory protein
MRRAGTSGPRRRPDVESCASDPEAIREAALRLLERTRRTRADLRRRLLDRGYSPAVIEPVLDRLASVGLVDDVEYARAYLTGRWGRKTSGWRRLEMELRRRGVPAADVDQARVQVEREVGPVSEVAAARRVIAQAARRLVTLEPRVQRRRLYALLVRRGFEGDTIEAALREEAAEEALSEDVTE